MQDTVDELYKKACEVFDLVPDEVELLYFYVYGYGFYCIYKFCLLIIAIIGRCTFGTTMVEQSML
jgi:hypothetical protein